MVGSQELARYVRHLPTLAFFVRHFLSMESAGRVLGNDCGLRGGVVVSSVRHLAMILLLLVETVDLVVVAFVGRANVVVALAL